VAVILYIAIKFSLVAPVMVREKVLSPINALRRSWNLTKGNSFRLALFYILLIIALLVISGVLTLVFGALALVGGTAGTVITALLNALLNMATVIVSMSIIASVHRQLAGDTPDNISITFG
jgi:membrane-anchored glycerophosphoryl diester phosphodiesterase (GDPDase)